MFRRSRKKVIAGICQAMADRTGIDVAFWRVFSVVGIFTCLPVLLTYVLLWICVPLEEITKT